VSKHRYSLFQDLLAESPAPGRGILSQTLSDEDDVRLVMFGFAEGEELSEHTSARPAIIHVLSGSADLTVDGDTYEAAAGTWVRMAPNTRHSLRARAPLVMALYLLPSAPDDDSPA
jgi:quercetin dioxygenase-like cupin family protein